MDDSSSNISTSSSTLEEMSNKSSEALGDTSAMGLVQQTSHNDSVTTSTSFSDMNVDSVTSDISFHDISGGASSGTGNQSMDSSLEGDQSGDIGVFHTKRKIHGKDKKVCRVCGDKALGYNFNAMTCESCKAFFRRNALKQQTPNCMFQGNCVVDVRTRRFCPHCRLKKCFNMGMKKEMILDESQRQVRMAKVEQNRQKHTCKVCLRKTGMFQDYKWSHNKAVFKRPCHHVCMVSETKPCSSRKKECCSGVSYKASKDNLDESLKENLKQCHSDVKRSLTEDEKTILFDLENLFLEKFESRHLEYSEENLSESHGLINLAALTVKKLVSFIKSVEEFKSLPIETQTGCLKAHMMCMLVWIAISHYDEGSESIHYMNSLPLHVGLLREAFQDHKEKIEMFIELCKSMTGEIIIDIPLQVILLCIQVFNPAREGLTNCRHLSNVQDIYLILLKHYLESKYSYWESKKFFAFFLQKLKDIRSADDNFSEIAQQIPVQKIEPLMREIFQV